MVYPVSANNGKYITLEDVKARTVNWKNIYVAPTKLICLENTISGVIMPIEEIARISEFAKANGIRMHLDGARLWNASAETGIPLSEYCKYFDTISLSVKGLGCPVGSVVVGDKATMDHAIWIRKQQGGGMRQVGMLTAAANVALDEVWPTMKGTHAKVKELSKYMESELGYKFEVPVETNFIFIDAQRSGIDISVFEEEARNRGLNVSSNRLGFHHQNSNEAIELLKETARAAKEKSKEMGIVPTTVQATNVIHRY